MQKTNRSKQKSQNPLKEHIAFDGLFMSLNDQINK